MDRSLDTRLRSRFSVALMSNAKWRRVFNALGGESEWLHTCTWKFVDEDEPSPGHIPDPEQLGDTFVGDCGEANGPFDFKRIQ